MGHHQGEQVSRSPFNGQEVKPYQFFHRKQSGQDRACSLNHLGVLSFRRKKMYSPRERESGLTSFSIPSCKSRLPDGAPYHRQMNTLSWEWKHPAMLNMSHADLTSEHERVLTTNSTRRPRSGTHIAGPQVTNPSERHCR